MLFISVQLVLVCALDWIWGEPSRYHPLVGFGKLATRLERRLNRNTAGKLKGLIAVLIVVAPVSYLVYALAEIPYLGVLISIVSLYWCIGHRSLHDHAEPVALALERGDDGQARAIASRIVSRDKDRLDASKATVESVLENGNDAVFAAIFWFVLGGAPAAVVYRLVNTLDAMWGYKTQRYKRFGWAAARLDDGLNYFPARLTALTYALLGDTRLALRCWRQQGVQWKSPNAGPVMAAGAGALGVQLGGTAYYGGQKQARIVLGEGGQPDATAVNRSLSLVRHGVLWWLGIALGMGLITMWVNNA